MLIVYVYRLKDNLFGRGAPVNNKTAFYVTKISHYNQSKVSYNIAQLYERWFTEQNYETST